ncbi:Acetylxylan esterase precursor [Symmachiella dynata]|uniref:Acetylxylan esterase n=1 Tax=Symmachiella dynata TaxID=2527995 RepID=A0A517ZHP5_9PLAN|nr:alpha/beta hydrolase [Symmachiella dynata]QDU41991.1 Acetylxylan esterase precursor [Symmachiella dynata]
MKKLWLKCPRWLRLSLIVSGSVIALLAILAGGGWWYLNPAVERTDGVVYGQRNDQPLVLDVIRPLNPNGLGVAFMVSGGWKSGKAGEAPVLMMAPLLRRGYTVFAIYHISQPKATVMEIIEDVNRGIRFVRHHAEEYGIDPDHIGVSGGSAGGHLSLMLATRGGPGPEDAEDPVDRESSAVQAAAIFFPVTDLLNLGQSTENLGDGGPPKSFVKSFGPNATDLTAWKEIGRECSPIYHITPDLPPILIYHGDADTLTPLEQSEWFRDRAAEQDVDVKLVVHPGGEHGWSTMLWDLRKFADWFDEHLKPAAAGS